MAIEVIVVGMGARGRDWVREVRSSPAYELAGGVDVDPAVLQSTSAALHIPRQQWFADLHNATDETSCQAVIIPTAPDCLRGASETALLRPHGALADKH